MHMEVLEAGLCRRHSNLLACRPTHSSERATPGERLAERYLVGILEVRADRQTTRQTSYRELRGTAAQLLGDMQRRGLSCGGGIGGEHHLSNAWQDPIVGRAVGWRQIICVRGAPQSTRYARVELLDLQILWLDAIDWRQSAPEHVVKAMEFVGALHWNHITGLLNDTDHARVATPVLADATAWLIGEVEAHLAQSNLLLDLLDRLGEPKRVLVRGTQNVESEPLRGAVANAREL